MDNTFTNYDTDATISLGDEEVMLSKYHNENTIYLYCALEGDTASKIINTNKYIVPMSLYETPQIAKAMAKNIANPIILRIAVNLKTYENEYYYDQLTMTDAEIKKRFKVGIEKYKSKCVYMRELARASNKQYVIQYTINKSNKMFINPQYID